MLFRTRRHLKIGGRSLKAGEVIDLTTVDLPPGRAQKLVELRMGEYVMEQQIACEECGKPFESERSLAIHKGRAHRDTTEE